MTLMTYFPSVVKNYLYLGKKMENEKVPNVLLAFLGVYPKIKSSLTGQSKKDFSSALKKIKEIKD